MNFNFLIINNVNINDIANIAILRRNGNIFLLFKMVSVFATT